MAPLPEKDPKAPFIKMLKDYIEEYNKGPAEQKKTVNSGGVTIELNITQPKPEEMKKIQEDALKLLPGNVKEMDAYHKAITKMMKLKKKLMPNYEVGPDNSQWSWTLEDKDAIKELRAQKNLTKEQRDELEKKITEVEVASEAMKVAQDKLNAALEKKAPDIGNKKAATSAIIILRQAIADDAAAQAKKELEAEMPQPDKAKPEKDSKEQGNAGLPDSVRQLAMQSMQKRGGGSTIPSLPGSQSPSEGRGQG
jgi:hypothetical protein